MIDDNKIISDKIRSKYGNLNEISTPPPYVYTTGTGNSLYGIVL